ncbi:MAG: hypothetical protein KGL03_08220, partial [Nitrospirota bacterium]|nr:hypothetical protein [Nitrospirota bacterium]
PPGHPSGNEFPVEAASIGKTTSATVRPYWSGRNKQAVDRLNQLVNVVVTLRPSATQAQHDWAHLEAASRT